MRLTRMSGTDFSRLPQANGQDASEWSSPTKGVVTSQQPPAVEPAKPAPLASPFTSSTQPDVGAATFKQPTLPSFGQSAGEHPTHALSIFFYKLFNDDRN